MRRVKKSRNGCARCKSKRVKCGEEKPHCTRCTRLGIRCPGYVQSLRWVSQPEQASPDPVSEYKPPSPARSSRIPGDPSVRIEDIGSLDDADSRPHQEPDSSEFDLNDSNGICEDLWDLPGNRSLPELTDLCTSSAATSSAATSSGFLSHDVSAVFDFAQSGDTVADLSDLLFLISQPQDEPDGHDNNIYRDFSPSTIVRSYPPALQRAPPHDFMSISRSLNNPSWTLIEYYFKEVAALFSSYDSQMNPFRTTVSRLWGSSLAMCRTMQSMAAATLVNDFPKFGPLGRKMRDEAIEIITREAVMDDKSLLALLMLGQTASWHDPTDLGISHFNLLRRQLKSLGSNSTPQPFGFPKSYSNNYRFFEEALIYWEMLLSFVADNHSVLPDDSRASFTEESLVLQRVPHPWTGIARDTQFTVHEVGRLVRRERKRIRASRFTSLDDITRAQLAIEKARELEDRLLNVAHPSEAEIISPGDDETPVWHLLTMAEVYRCTGLLQLYRAFPDLLRTRLPNPEENQFRDVPSTAQSDPFFPIDLDSMNLSQHTNQDTRGSPVSSSSHNINIFPLPTQPLNKATCETEESSTGLYDAWLTDFAVTLLSRLKTIPFESRTRCLQPLLLVASSSELRLPRLSADQRDESEGNQSHDNEQPGTETPDISMEAIEVSQSRKFILGRLTSLLHVLVKEVWRRMDAGETNTYWVDVMIEKGWETTMG
ncbi:transcriptional regulator family: Fungal Specific TF [Penicillium malachiteum]|uniref:transcriptional regulator family: Fungal Specific TF n=1 Tax=Penicillium malachiteum TaxID=1324776 RepID=UPI0025490347|nr:transcriptional regulator family: Fungal Specific TF [Penicillium malachiteum]KAJ5731701.1 transcriptional regulator family: Fungal Specific TF [Penicillium malachiteum]